MKTIILASSNKAKIKEIREFFKSFEVLAFSEIIPKFEIEENGKSFKENAIIKAKAIYEKLNDKNSIVLSDDSGISVPTLNYEPGIYSARYAGIGASDKENLNKLINELKKKNIKRTPAFYTACMAIATKYGVFTTHGWMHGSVIDEKKGKNGFGYDPMFIPLGYKKTLGELEKKIKYELSHRTKALRLAKILIENM
jgi:XTP/dITP diphosphohydrolase